MHLQVIVVIIVIHAANPLDSKSYEERIWIGVATHQGACGRPPQMLFLWRY
jgi:hypothetical protein